MEKLQTAATVLIVPGLRDHVADVLQVPGVRGAVALAYELWARWRYRGTDRRPRPLILLQGFVLWPTMVPEAVEGVLIDAGVLEPSWSASAPADRLEQRG